MNHMLPTHSLSETDHTSLQPTYGMDPNGVVTTGGPPPQAPAKGNRKRQRASDAAANAGVSVVGAPGGPEDVPMAAGGGRRLRRLHEACARCRMKKIKCDSKHPKCTACTTAGVVCNQEDRYRRMLTPRGHGEFLEYQLKQCVALIRHLTNNPTFAEHHLDEVLAKEGIVVNEPGTSPSVQYFAPNGEPTVGPPPPQFPPGGPPPSGHMVGHPLPYGQMPPPGMYPPGAFPPQMGPPPAGFVHPHPAYGHPQPQPLQPLYGLPHATHSDVRGRDPNKNDMSSETALMHTFSLAPTVAQPQFTITKEEDLAVGSGTLASGRDLGLNESTQPRDKSKWISVSMRRNTLASLMNPPTTMDETKPDVSQQDVLIWLPRDRKTVNRIVQVYFERLNYHRPVFTRDDFEQRLDALYSSRAISHDPGFICSLYLILALGTMSEISHVVGAKDHEGKMAPPDKNTPVSQLMPKDWPEYEDLFERALVIKPDLRVTISSLQALILLHWYLYTERQGRSLWRLVGSLVRLSIELGLHHDPRTQKEVRESNGQKHIFHIFNEEECQMRIRLWDIVMIHDRGTSILLGRPLAISPHDSNTPPPSSTRSLPFSEHYQFSHMIADIQAVIVNSLYIPQKLYGEQLLGKMTRVLDQMAIKQKLFPAKYQNYFGGTAAWAMEDRIKLVDQITADEGLTLLKMSITRLLLMRAMFRAENGLPVAIQHSALRDAVSTAHNIIVLHNQLIRFPDAAFFVSPIPLHIAAFIILFAHEYRCTSLPADVEISDVWMALDMLPRFRWRWERKDYNGGHPVIHNLAERVLNVDLKQVGPASHPVLLCEETDWAKLGKMEWSMHTHGSFPATTTDPTGTPVPTTSPLLVKREPSATLAPDATALAQQGLYPHLLDNMQTLPADVSAGTSSGGGTDRTSPATNLGRAHEEFSRAWTQHGGLGAYQQSDNAYVLEERDGAPVPHNEPQWMQVVRGSGSDSQSALAG